MGELGPLKADDFEVHYMGHYNPSIKYCNGDIYYKGTVISFAIPDTSDPTFTKISNTGDKRFFRVYGGVEKEYTIDNSIKDLVADIINNS